MRLAIRLAVGALVVAGVVAPARAGYRLAEASPASRPDTYVAFAGAHVSTNVVAKSPSDAVIARYPRVAVGWAVSERGPSLEVGSFLAPPDDAAIDWEAMAASVATQPAVTNGYVFFVPTATNSAERLVVARGGTFDLTWSVRDEPPRTVTYFSATPASVVPHRLFWTSAPFNGPTVSLPQNYGIELYGDPSLFYDESHTNANGSGLYDFGVHYSRDNSSISAYASVGADGTTSGPNGVFVVAYYDSGEKVRYLGCTVVTVSGPDPVYLKTTVGAEVRPQNEHYDPASTIYTSSIRANTDGTDDPRAPYFHVQKRSSTYHKKENRVFAISPTRAGESGAKLAEIYWEGADDFDVLWPMEETCYHIAWPEKPVVAVGRDPSDRGVGVTIPESYTATLLDYREPTSIATLDDHTLTFRSEGHCTLKLTNAKQDDFALVPLTVRYSDDASVFPVDRVRTIPVGREIRPRAASRQAMNIDASYPGVIYAPNSPGRNWNATLYAGEAATSTVHFVNVPATSAAYDLEIWWRGAYRSDDSMMTEPIVYPALVERCRAAWPDDDNAQLLVIASQKGSATGGRVAAGNAVTLATTNAVAVCSFSRESDDEGFAVRFAFDPFPADAETTAASTGSVLSVAFGDAVLAFARVGAPTTAGVPLDVSYAGRSVAKLVCPSNRWTSLTAVMETNNVLSLYAGTACVATQAVAALPPIALSCELALGVAEDGVAASGVAVDAIRVWNAPIADETLKAAETNSLSSIDKSAALIFDFDDMREVDGELSSQDPQSLRTLVLFGCEILEPGSPVWHDGIFAATDSFAPRAYAENDATAAGYRPNIEHALMLSETGGYALYALRTDMNDDTLPPFVLAEYAENGRGAMRAFRVVATNAWYAWPTIDCEVGKKIPFIHPFDALPSGLCSNTTITTTGTVGEVPFRDRAGTTWAACEGTFEVELSYWGEETFVCNAGTASERDLKGCPVRGLELSKVGVKHSRESIAMAGTTPFAGKADWPSGVPQMSVAQVLSKAEDGLPDVYDMKTCAVIHPAKGAASGRFSGRIVKLIDPTIKRTKAITVKTSFPDEYGFTLGDAGTCYLKNGCYFFRNLPPNVSGRLFVEGANLVLIGDYVENAAGTSYLRANTLSTSDVAAIQRQLRKACSEPPTARQSELLAAVADLATADVQPSAQVVDNGKLVRTDYDAADHYALVATGEGSGYVTLVENDGAAAKNEPVSLHVLYVTTNLYCGKLVTVTDSANVLSEQANVVYTAPLGKAADDFEFVWQGKDAPADGQKPEPPFADAIERTDATTCLDAVGGANGSTVSMKDLVNRYWTMHYRARSGTDAATTTGGRWSAWCSPTLVEGWVQRVLNAITPFAQRLTDLTSNQAELKLTMPAQIGAPWEGDVALNNENLNNVGLVQLYQTILNRAESMSIAQGLGTTADDTNAAVNKQLIECVARLADMHMTLGAEAYSDAQNPTIGASSDSTIPTGSVFCFANQVPSLLDEELALLRGRTKGVAPDLTESPFYNRLMWNFTKGVTQGEVAYVNNYNISAVDGVLDASAAAAMYPQGHGDAYGYYLSALKGYYRLLRNPNFQWGQASMMEMLVADHVVNMDYQEEDKFAECAYNLAKIGAEVVKKTAIKQYRDNNGDLLSAYFDDPTTCLSITTPTPTTLPQSFGTGEWACRAGYGALCNWAVANSILPPSTNEATLYFTDQSILTVTRETSDSLSPLAASVETVETTLNTVDSGGNVLGLDAEDIPFREISAAELRGSVTGQGAKTPYEQLRTIAGAALTNAQETLAYANVYGSRIAAIENEQAETEAEAAEMEASYEKDLIAIYGRPYADDIGPGKTYEQGYTGPDLYHYMYVDLSAYGLTNGASFSVEPALLVYENPTNAATLDANVLATLKTSSTGVTYAMTVDGLVAMPTNWIGTRAAEGSIQAAYRNYLTAYVAAQAAVDDYEKASTAYANALSSARTSFSQASTVKSQIENSILSIGENIGTIAMIKTITASLNGLLTLIECNAEPSWTPNDFGTAVTLYRTQESMNTALAAAVNNKDNDHTAFANFFTAVGNAVDTLTNARGDDVAKNAAIDKVLSTISKTDFRKAGVLSVSAATIGSLDSDDVTSVVNSLVNFNTKYGNVLNVDNFLTVAGQGHALATALKEESAKVDSNYFDYGSSKFSTLGANTYKDKYLEKVVRVTKTNQGNTIKVQQVEYNPHDQVVGWANSTLIAAWAKEASHNYVKKIIYYITGITTALEVTRTWLSFAVANSGLTVSATELEYDTYVRNLTTYNTLRSAAEDVNAAVRDLQNAFATFLTHAQEYRTVLASGEALLAARTLARTRLANVATQKRYADMYARVSRNTALSKYNEAFDLAQKRVYELARLYDYETGLGAVGTPSAATFADAALVTRALGTAGIVADGSSVYDGGLWEIVSRMDANYAQVKTSLGFNNPDDETLDFSLRYSKFRIASGAKGDEVWRQELAKYWRNDIFADARVAANCQPPAGAIGAQPGFVIPFESTIQLSENFFGRPLAAGDKAFSSSKQGVKVFAAGLVFAGYENLVAANGLAEEPNVYLVPVGTDRQRLTDGTKLVERSFTVAASRHSTLRAGGDLASRELVARSVWNDKWLLVIPAAALNGDPTTAKKVFLNGINGHPGVSDITLRVRAYGR